MVSVACDEITDVQLYEYQPLLTAGRSSLFWSNLGCHAKSQKRFRFNYKEYNCTLCSKNKARVCHAIPKLTNTKLIDFVFLTSVYCNNEESPWTLNFFIMLLGKNEKYLPTYRLLVGFIAKHERALFALFEGCPIKTFLELSGPLQWTRYL